MIAPAYHCNICCCNLPFNHPSGKLSEGITLVHSKGTPSFEETDEPAGARVHLCLTCDTFLRNYYAAEKPK